MTGQIALGTAVFICFHILPISFFYVPTVFIAGIFHGATAVRVFVVGSALVVIGVAASAKGGDDDQGGADVLTAVRAPLPSVREGRGLLDAAVVTWYAGLLSIGSFIDSARVVSTSLHQPFGAGDEQCSEMELYFWGAAERRRYGRFCLLR